MAELRYQSNELELMRMELRRQASLIEVLVTRQRIGVHINAAVDVQMSDVDRIDARRQLRDVQAKLKEQTTLINSLQAENGVLAAHNARLLQIFVNVIDGADADDANTSLGEWRQEAATLSADVNVASTPASSIYNKTPLPSTPLMSTLVTPNSGTRFSAVFSTESPPVRRCATPVPPPVSAPITPLPMTASNCSSPPTSLANVTVRSQASTPVYATPLHLPMLGVARSPIAQPRRERRQSTSPRRSSPPSAKRRLRRRMSVISYREPSLVTKMRRSRKPRE